MQRRPRRYSASRRGVRGRIGGGSGGWQFTPPGNMVPVAPVPPGGVVPAPPGVLPPPPGGAVPPGSIAQPAPVDQPPPGPAPATGYGGQNNPNNPYAGTNYNYGGSPTQADKAIINGVEVWAGGPYSGQPVASTPANAGDLTPYLKNPGQAPPADSVAGGAKIQKPLVQSPPAGFTPTAPAAGATVQPAAPVKYDPNNPAQAAAAAANAKNVKPGQVPKWVGPGGVLIYDAGGMVDEPVLAKGARSGKTYLFIGGEKITPMDTGLSARHHSPASAAAPSSAPLKRPGKN